MKSLKVLLIHTLLSLSAFTFAQNTQVDSLKSILLTVEVDTSRVNILNEIAATLYRTSPNDAIMYSSDAKTLADKVNFTKGLADAYKNIGLGHYMQGNYSEAFKNWDSSLEIYRDLGNDQLISNILSNQGSIYYTYGKNVEAIEYYLQALKIAEKLGDSIRIGTLLQNIGLVYSEQPATLDTARNYYIRAIEMGEYIGYQDLVGVGSINLGETFFKQGAYDSALFYFEKSLSLVTNDIDSASTLSYIGRCYSEKEDFRTAIVYLKNALKIAVKENSQLEIARISLGLASTYRKQGGIQLAIHYFEQVKNIGEKLGLNSQLAEAYEGLAYTYAEVLDYRKAFENLSRQRSIDNALYRIESDNKTNSLMFSYQLEKKEDEIEILEQQSEIERLRSKRQKGISITAGSIGLLLLILAIGFYNRIQFVRRTNEKINTQKDEIESQRDDIQAARDEIQLQHDVVFSQKEMITDSISYAQRIQSAMLPSQALMDELIPENFIFFRPKDIVSGDFYWVKEVLGHVVIVGADCTGHGVPGAFMSMLGITLLNDLIGDRCFNAPGAILDQLRLKIKELLVQEGNVEEAKDGMDMVIAIINKTTKELHFSGANNPLYIIRNKKLINGPQLESYTSLDNDEYQLFELKGDKQPIGVHWEETPFRTTSISLQDKDTIYMFSDGFVDQFGGENRKKFKTLVFKRLLLSIQEESMENQKHLIEDAYEKWRGDIEQIDDVSVLGFRI